MFCHACVHDNFISMPNPTVIFLKAFQVIIKLNMCKISYDAKVESILIQTAMTSVCMHRQCCTCAYTIQAGC